jgi:amino acid adenylation domain-containing protein/non-ribosomal peptide synthase protein (TIGR01720 family)
MKESKKLDKGNIEDIIALTPIQEGILFHYLKNPETGTYHEQLNLELVGNIDISCFEAAWNFVIETNEMLRTVFRWENKADPVQVVLKNHKLQKQYFDISSEDRTERKELLEDIKRKDRDKKFNLEDVAFRVILGKVDTNRYEMIISNHHILYDGWSNGIILGEFFGAYNDLVEGKPLKPLVKTKFKEFVKGTQKQDLKRQEKYWTNYLKDFTLSTGLSIKNKIKDRNQDKLAGTYSTNIPSPIKDDLHRFVKEVNITPASLLYSALGILLQRYNNCDDILLGTTVSGRSAKIKGIENMVGLFINTLPLRIQTLANEKAFDLICRIQEVLAQREEYERTSLVDIRKYSELGNGNRGELFDVIVAVENYPLPKRIFEQNDPCLLTIESYSLVETTHYDLYIGIIVSDDMVVSVNYSKDYFNRTIIENMVNHFIHIVNCILQNPGIGIHKIEILSVEEKTYMIFNLNATCGDYSQNRTIHELLEEQAAKTPGQAAVVYGNEFLTYFELNQRSNQLAGRLRDKGIKPGINVGLIVEFSSELLIGLAAVLKAGGTYVPIDTAYPDKRIISMLRESDIGILLVNSQRGRIFDEYELIDLTEVKNDNNHKNNLSPLSHSRNLAYIIFTSGTTGEPKGVMIEHRSVINLFEGVTREIPFAPGESILSLASISFDIFVIETLLPLTTGVRIVMASQEERLNSEKTGKTIEKQNITILQVTPSRMQLLLEGKTSFILKKIAYLIVTGEALPNWLLKKIRTFASGQIYNMYGPTETTVWSSLKNVTAGSLDIGKPFLNTRVYILSKEDMLQPVGVPGELCIAGHGLARGYLNKPELTDEKFNHDLWDYHDKQNKSFCRGSRGAAFSKSAPLAARGKLYKTGDLARWLQDGNIEFLGRIDHQLKIRGFRIEPGEIEHQLVNYPGIKDAVVIAKESPAKSKNLCAFIVSEQESNLSELRRYLYTSLPDYMIPSEFIRLEKIPVNSNGKVDRKALESNNLPGTRLDTPVSHTAPGSEIEKIIADTWKEVLQREKVGIHDNFFDIGGNSFSIIRLNSRLKEAFKKDIPVTDLFNYPTVASLAHHLYRGENQGREVKEFAGVRQEIAVIGMSGRFPGAKNIDEFWENLKNGVESIWFFSDNELELSGTAADYKNNPDYVKAKGVLEGIEFFDASFFEYTGSQAELMDPQIRIFHECCWNALENAGYDPHAYKGLIGLYAGAAPNPGWEAQSLLIGLEAHHFLEQWEALQFRDKDYLSTRVSYKLNLKGPAVTVQTACSTSLAAIDMACQGLLTARCDIALAGGVSITLHDQTGYFYQEGMIMSRDGHCRAFDERATGTVNGNAAAVVVLKPLKEAEADRDFIYAVIKGSAVNNDGTRKVGFTAPSIEGQAEAIRIAHRMAAVESESISYLETHGTGTILGDPIEIEALKLAFQSKKKCFCGIGSVKTNIGHLDAAAGVAGFIKTVLALKHRLIPPSLHFETLNPKITPNSPFYVNKKLTPWKKDKYPPRAGVSSFGIGGTNIHMVLEEAPRIGTSVSQWVGESVKPGAGGGGLKTHKDLETDKKEYHLILLSAKTGTALDKIAQNLARHFKKNPHINPTDAAYTLQVGRKAMAYRSMLVCSNLEEAVEKIQSGEVETGQAKEEKSTVIFMFSGQGSQYVNMGLDLYQQNPVFRHEVDRCFELLEKITGKNMKPILYPGLHAASREINKAEEKIYQFLYTTPIKFIFEYSLAALLMKWGIQPGAMIGHSFGEYVCACISGVFSLEDGLFLSALRGELMHGLPEGAMLGVPLAEEQLRPLLVRNDKLSLAAVNGESLCVVSGPVDTIDTIENQLKEKGHECIRFRVPKAGHSWMVEPILEEFKKKIERVKFNKPQIPYISGLTGKWTTAREAMDPGYWTRHLREAIRFADGLTTLFKESNPVFLEVGPGRGLTLFVNLHPDKTPGIPAINMVRHRKEGIPDYEYTLSKVGHLWLYGLKIDWASFYAGEKRSRIPLPTYPFEGSAYPVDKNLFRLEVPGSTMKLPSTSASAQQKKADPAEWFYVPSWERVMSGHTPAVAANSIQEHGQSCVLIFMDRYGLGIQLKKQLEHQGLEVIFLNQGAASNPSSAKTYDEWVRELVKQGKIPSRVYHLWGIGTQAREGFQEKEVEKDLAEGFYSVLFLVRALGKYVGDASREIRLELVTSHAQEVTGDEELRPGKAPLYGLARVIPQEYPNMQCRCIDVPLVGEHEAGRPVKWFRQLAAALSKSPTDWLGGTEAYRGGYRWVQSFKPIRLEKPPAAALPLRSGGVYLITGGTGAIGLVLARHLARFFKAKLILTCRSVFPDREEWQHWLSTHAADDRVSRKIKRLQEIEALGGQVLVTRADAASLEQMQAVVKRAGEQWGTINGMIHAAGIVGDKAFTAIKDMGKTEAHLHFEPKIYGLLVLARIMKNREVDFCLVMSSTSSVLGGLGFAAYSAANVFMDAYIHHLNRCGDTRWISVNWDGWQLEEQQVQDTSLGTLLKELAMTPEEGAEVFERVLSCEGLTQVVQCTGDLQARIDRWLKPGSFKSQDKEVQEAARAAAPLLQARPFLPEPYIPPRNRVEEESAKIWQDLLGYNRVGIRDNFFKLGGDSLKAVIVISKIHKQLNIKIPLKDFFAHPTIEEIVQCLNRARSTWEILYSPLEAVEKKEYYRLSSAQQRMYILNRYERENRTTAYNTPTHLEMHGELDIKRLEGAIHRLIHRHESLRTSFLVVEGEPVQQVHDEVEFKIKYFGVHETHEKHEENDQSKITNKDNKKRTTETTPQSKVFTGGPGGQFLQKEPPWPPEAAIKEFIRPFDLSRAPLLRVGVIKLTHTPAALRPPPSQDGKEHRYILMVDMHHIVSDGTSMVIVLKEVFQFLKGEDLPLLRLQYKDYAWWQNREKEKERIKQQQAYWLKELPGELPVLELPLDFPRTPGWNFQGGLFYFELGKQETSGLKELAKAHQATLYMVLVSVYIILLSKITNQEDIVIGVPVAGRDHADVQGIIGVFVNTLVLRGFPMMARPYHDFLLELKSRVLGAFENQDYPFEELAVQKEAFKEVGRNPLFDAALILQNMIMPGIDMPGLKLKPYVLGSQSAKLDLSLFAEETGDTLQFTFEYRTALFKQETVERLSGYFREVVSGLLTNPDQKIGDIGIISKEEKVRLLHEFNDTTAALPLRKSIHQLFREQVHLTPDQVALVGKAEGGKVRRLEGKKEEEPFGQFVNASGGMQLSYKELNEKSNRLAHELQIKGVGPDIIVGIMVERSVEMMVGIMGILKADGAYLPIAPDYPKERINYMLADSGAKILVTTGALVGEGEEARRWESEKNLEILFLNTLSSPSFPLLPATGNRQPATFLAYAIYTSGTTGKPKGVVIEHRSLVNRLNWMQKKYPLNTNDTILQKTTFTFDVSVWEIFWWSIVGAKVCLLIPGGEKDPEIITQTVERNNVTTIHFVPSMLSVFLDYLKESGNVKKLSSLKQVIASGEALLPTHVERFNELLNKENGAALANLYGPTEATIDVSYFDCREGGEKEIIPIGKPIDNLRLYILDKNLQIQPVGVTGELCIAGIGLARGYLNQPGLTAEKFDQDLWDYQDYHDKKQKTPGKNKRQLCNHASMPSPHHPNTPIPHSPHSPIYRTGDLARWLPDGNIEFLGRIDRQVKIRGFRIELGEIESRLLNVSGVKEAVMLVREEVIGDKYICAYFVSDREYGMLELRESLSKELPDYMIPSYFVQMEKIPLTPNGKVDRGAFPGPEGISLREEVGYTLPSSVVEKKLVEIWEKVLGRDNIGINENFFMIGGDSIKSVLVISRMSGAGYKLEMKDLFKYPVISALAPRVKKLKRIPDQSAIKGIIPLTPIQEDFFSKTHIDSHHYNQAVMLYSREGFAKGAVMEVFSKIQEHHDVLRITYKLNPGNGEIVQIGHDPGYPLSLQEYDLKDRGNSLEELNAKINQVQAGIDLEKGPLMKLGLFHLDDGDRLLIAVHHLVIDGVSWRILFEDIETLYGQYKRGEELVLPSKTDSFKLWSEKLSAYADDKIFLQEKAYWKKIGSVETSSIPKDFDVDDGDDDYIKDTVSVSFTLSEKETGDLLKKVNEMFGTEINDILLTALGMGIKKTWGHDRVLIALEGHGREEILEDLDISRTVGWFTSLYPVLIDISYSSDPGRQIKEIKETLRRIPNKGVGYGILKYLTGARNKKDIRFKLKPQTSFNYLGQFDADVKQKSFFEITGESAGNSQSLNIKREYVLDVSGMTANNRLTMTISYNKMHFKPETMTQLIGNFESELRHLIAFCCAQENIERTPSDFTYKGLSIERVDGLMKEYPGIEDIYTLTPMQEGMLFHSLVDDTSSSYFEQMSYRLQAELDIELVEKSLNELFKRHDILRTVFVYKDVERPVQVVLKERAVDFYYEDISQIGEREEKQVFIDEYKEKDKVRSFNLEKDVLMRLSIFRVDESGYEFTWSHHHILMDGWCLGILNSEFFEIYNAYLENRPNRLPGVKAYRTYIRWLEKQDKETAARYWANYLESFEEQTGVPKTRISKEGSRYKNETVSVVLDKEKTAGLNKLAGRNHVTLNTVTQAVWGILLGRYNGKEDMVFGAVVSGRPSGLEGVESMVGLFINTIPVRIKFEGKMKFYRLLQQVQEEALAGEPYHYHPLAEIQSGTALKQNLINHLFVYENYPIAEQLEGYGREKKTANKISLKLANVEIFEQTNYDFNIVLVGPDRLRISFKYNENVHDRDFVERIAKHFSLIVDQVIENPGSEIKELTLLAEEEKNRLLYEFNDTEAVYPKDKTIRRLFEEQVERTPYHIAVIGQSVGAEYMQSLANTNAAASPIIQLSYRELNESSNQFAYQLREKSVGPDSIVGLMGERSVEMIIGMLGILKSGGAYLPIDPDYPKDRIDYMLKDSGAKVLVTTHTLAPEGEKVRSWEEEKILLEKIPKSPKSSTNLLTFLPSYLQNSSNLAYIIYTSGTTGKSKGTLIENKNLVNYVGWFREKIHLSGRDRTVLTSSFSFDLGYTAIYPSILTGCQLHIIPRETYLSPEDLIGYINRHGITYIKVTPSLFTTIVENSKFSQIACRMLRLVVLGGEALKLKDVEKAHRIAGHLHFMNHYGPTEATIGCVAQFIDFNGFSDYRERPTIGHPVHNMKVVILDNQLKLVPVGVPGELSVSGAGVARGYLNRPLLTAEKFIVHPYIAGERMYHTGDMARWTSWGDVAFLGRIDTQVKIRGYRIEPGEIENRLLTHEAINEVVVIPREYPSADKYLCAYIVLKNRGSINISALKEYLAVELPDYIIPTFFVELDRIPLTPNGKLSRKLLPEPEMGVLTACYAAPRDPVEKKLVEMWQEILEVDRIGIDDQFFQLGGHSLKAIILISRMNKAFHVNVPLAEIFRAPAIRGLSAYIKSKKEGLFTPIEPVEEKDYHVLSSTQKRLYILHQMDKDSTSYNIPSAWRLEGEVNKNKLEEIFLRLIARHESLRTSFQMVAEVPIQWIHEEVKFEIECYDFGKRQVAISVSNQDTGEDRKLGRVKVRKRGKEVPPGQIHTFGEDTSLTQTRNTGAIIKNFIRPFDLSRAPLLRVGLLKVEKERYLFMMDMHHIISDAVSRHLLVSEFMALAAGKDLLPLRLQYKDFSEWQNSEAQREAQLKQKAYWKKQLEGEIPVLDLPGDFVRPTIQKFEGSRVTFAIGQEEVQILQSLAFSEGVTLYMILLAIYYIFLSKLSNQEEILVGTPTVGRRHADLEQIIGMFVNTLVLRNYPRGEQTYREFLTEIKKRSLEAFENQDYPYEELVEELAITRDASRNPLFDTMFVMQSLEIPRLEIPGLKLKPYDFDSGVSHFDLVFIAGETGEQLSFYVEYSTRLFKKATIERMIRFFKHILSSILANPHREISAISLIGEEEKHQVLVGFNSTEADYFGERTIHRWFQEQAGKTPDRIAVVSRPAGLIPGREEKARGTIQLTYKKLNEKSNQLARLLKSRGMAPGSTAALLMDSSIEMIIGILGILKAGGAYQPIDPTYPGERIRSILEDSQAPVLLTQNEVLLKLPLHFTFLKKLKTPTVEPFKTIPRQQIKDLNILPPPDRTLVDYEKYLPYVGLARAKNTITLQATRGCPYNCLYCHKIWPKKHMMRSADHIFEEVRFCYEAGVRRFSFVDDIFNLHEKNSGEFLRKIIKHGLDVQLYFPNGLRGDILTKDFIDLMIEAGTIVINLALETASPRLQKRLGKNLNLEKFQENVHYIANTYPQVVLDMELMIGFPTETEEEALQTLEMLKSFKWIHFPGLNILKIFPNTDMYRFAIENGVSRESIEKSTNLAYQDLPETLPFSKNFTRQYQARFMNEYFLSRERLLDVLPVQMRTATEDELVQKYNSYLPVEVKSFSEILHFAAISKEELGKAELKPPDYMDAPDFNKKIRVFFPGKEKKNNAFKILLLDLSLLFSRDSNVFYDMIEEPLGLMALLTYLDKEFTHKIQGKIAKSRIDFDDYNQLKTLITDFKPDLIGMRTLTLYREFFHRTISLIRQWGIEVPIIAGGPYATSDYNHMLQDPYINLAVLGEGELTLAELVEKMIQNNKHLPGDEILKHIPGIVFVKESDKAILKGNNREVILLGQAVADNEWSAYANENLDHADRIDDLLYLISTSGSTGSPKSITLEHRNLANLLCYEFSRAGVDFSGHVLQFAAVGFDVSAQEIFSTLISGGKLHLMDSEMKSDLPRWFDFIRENQIEIVFLPPVFLRFIFDDPEMAARFPTCVRHIIAAGDALVIPGLLKNHLCRHRVYLHNHYGPSETHVVTAFIMDPAGEIPGLPPLGKPISNTQIYILDKYSNPQPIGIAGELCIGGNNVGRGYLNNPELTNEKFCLRRPGALSAKGDRCRLQVQVKKWKTSSETIPLQIGRVRRTPAPGPHKNFLLNPSDSHQTLIGSPHRGALDPRKNFLLNHSPLTTHHSPIYKTGDLARWQPDGNIEFSGRIDHQVKIRGFRIELGEIENQLTKYPGIKETLVINKEINGEKCLCAYVVSHKEIDISEIRNKLSETLPEYMIPSYFLRLEGLPISPNGKIDRKALPDPELKIGDRYTAPRDEIEKQLVKIWTELLKLEERVIGIDVNFFAIGGHSLKATLLTNKIYKIFQVEIPLVEIFKQQTIRELSKYIKRAVKVSYVSIEPAEKKEYYGLSSAQKRLHIHQQMQPGSTMYNIPGFFVLEEEVDESGLEWVFKKMIHRHESLRTSIEIVGKEAVQRIYDQVPFKIENYDISGFNDKSEQEERIIRHFVRPFDLSRPPLFRVGLIKTGPGRTDQLLMVDMNHIVTDGVSIKLLMWEFISLLAREELPRLKLQYKDYAVWQRGILEKGKGMMNQQERYWIKEFSEEIPVLVLPTDYPRPQVQRFEGGKVSFTIGMEETRGLKKLAAQEQATLYMVLLAVFNILLSKLSNQEIMVVGTAVAGRQHPNLEKIIGMFVNTVALKNHPSGGKSFIQFLGEVKENTLNTFDNQDYQFEELVEKIVVKRDRSRNPLFDVMFEMIGDEFDWVDLAQGKIRYYNEESQEYINPESKFDMTLVAIDNTGPLSFKFIYNTHLFKEKSIYRFVDALKHIIEKVTDDNKIPIAEINVFSPSEGSEVAARLYDDLEIEMEA